MLPWRNEGRNLEIKLDSTFLDSNNTRHETHRVQNEMLDLKKEKGKRKK